MSNDGYPVSRKTMYLFFFVMNMFLTTFRFFIIPGQPLGYHISVSIASLLGFWGLWEFILYLGNRLENKLPIAYHVRKRIIYQILLTYLLATLIGEFLLLATSAIFHMKYSPVVRAIGLLLYFMLVVVLNLMYFGTIYFFNWKKDLVKLANVQKEQAVVRYDILKNQMNPHFLFNALTSLNSLIVPHPQLASDFLQQLSKVYRYVLQHKEKETVSLNTELQFIANYIFLLKTRFNNAIEFEIKLSEEAKEKDIVPVTLQILFENAIKHNVISLSTPLKITVTADKTFLIIQNNLNLKDQVESSNKVGLENLKSLYRYLVDTSIVIEQSSEFFTVKIPLI